MIQRFKYCIISFFVVFLIWNSLNAQNISFQKYGLKEGLSSTRVFTTIEDEFGFLWLATDAGIDRFDGANFKHYTLSNFENIRRSRFYRFFLRKDKNNQIWLLANNGILYKYSITKDEFILFHRLKDDTGSQLIINSFHIDHNGKFWIGDDNGVYTFDIESQKTEQYPGLSSGIHAIIQDEKNYFYLAGNGGVFVLNENYRLLYNLIEVCPTPDVDIKGGRIRSLFVDEKYKRLWMGTDKQGLCAFNLTDYKFILPEGLENHIGLSIRAIKQYSSESLIVSFDGVGLYILDLDKLKPIDKFSFKQDDPNSLSSNSIFDIYQNKNGIFFISTFRGGLNVYNPYQLNIQAITQIPGEINSLENNNILSICEVSNEMIGFGTAKGVSLWNKSNNSWKHLSEVANKNNILSGFVHAVAVDGEKNLWTSSYSDGITRYNLSDNGQYTISDKIPAEGNSGEIRCIYSTKQDLIYFANLMSGIISYSISSGTTQLYPIEGISVITQLSEKMLALGGSSGLWFLDTQKAKIEKPEFIQLSMINDQVVNSLCVDTEKKLWVGTADAGVFVVNFSTNTIEQISILNGLPSNFIFSIVEAGSFIWVSTNKGISRIDKERRIYTLYESDGLISTDFNKNVAISASNGFLYFGTNNGVIYFDPNNIKPVKSQTSLVLTDFYVNHKLTFAGKKSPLKKAINSTKKIELEYAQNSFAVGFSIIDFIHPGINRIEWKLEGLDENWISYDKTDRIYYTNLSPDTYVLKLRIVNEKKEVLTDEKHIEIIVKPPFWRTTWAYLIYAFTSVLLIIAIVYFSRLKIESKKSEERLYFLINTAHEIKTPLTLIKTPLQDLLNNKSFNSNIKKNLNIALKNVDKLQNQMIKFLDFYKFREQAKTQLTEDIDMLLFFQEKLLAFKGLCKRNNINLTFNSSVSEFYIKANRNIIDLVVSNLISNAIKYTKENGTVSINLLVKNKVCEIIVHDTGIGIPKSQQKKIFNLFYRAPEALKSRITGSGIGLALAFNLAKQINGKVVLVESSDKGSTFKFSFPYKLSHLKINAGRQIIEEDLDEELIEDGKKAKLLFVEDDNELRKFSRSKLNKKYHTITASNGKSALEKVKKNMPDIIISDVLMPKMNGRQLCMNLKNNINTCHIPIILLTGLSSKENEILGLESGADVYITKPIDFDVLITKIDGLLKNRQILKRKFLQLTDDGSFELINELDKSFLNNITRYIEENISDPEFSLNDLYQISGMSRTVFYNKLKALIDLSPSDFIRSIRFKKAIELFKKGKNNISEVSYSIGFSDPKYFSTSFKKHFGQTPTSFIAQISNEN